MMDHYSHVGLYDLNAALESLPSLQTKPETMKATGTDDGKNVVAGMVAGVGDISCNSMRMIESADPAGANSNTNEEHSEKPLRKQRFDGDCDSLKKNKRRERDSNPRSRENPTHRISNPAHSAALPSLRDPYIVAFNSFLRIRIVFV